MFSESYFYYNKNEFSCDNIFALFANVNFGWRRCALLFFISNGDRYHGHQKEFAFNVHWSLKAKHDLSCFKAMEEYTFRAHAVMNFKKAFRIK